MNTIEIFFERLDNIAKENERFSTKASTEKNIIDIRKGRISFLFIPTKTFKDDINKSVKGNINILGALNLELLQDYGYCKITNELVSTKIVEDLKSFIMEILSKYSYDVTDFIMLDLKPEKVIAKNYTIKDIRIGLGLDQSELATLLGTNQTYVSALENGKRNQGIPIVNTIKNLVPLLDVGPILTNDKGEKKAKNEREKS